MPCFSDSGSNGFLKQPGFLPPHLTGQAEAVTVFKIWGLVVFDFGDDVLLGLIGGLAFKAAFAFQVVAAVC